MASTTALKIDLSPKKVDLVLYSGDGVRFNFIVTDVDQLPVDISTSTIEAQIRLKRGEANTVDPLAEFAVDLSDGANGVATLSLTGDQTQQIAPTKNFIGVWDLQWTPSGGEPKTLVQGKVECIVDVSR